MFRELPPREVGFFDLFEKHIAVTKGGVSVSNTQTITGAIVGVSATKNASAVRWGVAGRIRWACGS